MEPMSHSIRPIITVTGSMVQSVMHNGLACRVLLRRNLISVGCTDITPEAAQYILKKWAEKFNTQTEEYILQP